MKANIYITLLKEIKQKQADDEWVNLGDIDNQETRDKISICKVLKNKGFIEYKTPPGGASFGKSDGTIERLPALKGNLEAKITFDGNEYLKKNYKQWKMKCKKILKPIIIGIIITVVGGLIIHFLTKI